MVGATNRPDLLDRSLLRPGRLDRMVYLGVAGDKRPLLKAISRKFVLEDSNRDALLERVAEQCPSNLTGADVSVLCADAYSIAQREHIAKLHELAEGLKVQISSLLLFLDLWELHLSNSSKPRTFQSLWNDEKLSAQLGVLLLGLTCLTSFCSRFKSWMSYDVVNLTDLTY